MTSKKEVKALTLTLGRPQQQYQRALWCNRLRAYRRETLGANLSVPPSGQDLERFLSSIGNRIKTNSPHGVPTYDYLCQAVPCIIQKLSFDYPDFKLSPQESLRIRSLLDSLVKQNKLTKNPVDNLTG